MSESQGREHRFKGEMGWKIWLVALDKGHRGKETWPGCVVSLRRQGHAQRISTVSDSRGREHRFKGERMGWQAWLVGLGRAGFLVWEDRITHSHWLHGV